MESLIDLFKFIIERKKYYLIPIVIFVVIVGILAVATENPYLSPFIYSLF
ncbi:DUF5989 family protein [Persicobacter diffluens]|uniref:SxtK n=1 Tax=Persicobacter diffluens TaxID=981 RepID=A0AAN4W5J2_9BACT|nr:hypothetical protein PEDI_55020 [Persicobacter diffluens]